MNDSDALNRRHAIAGELSFRPWAGGIVVADVDNGLARARISLQGGQLLAWQPRDQANPVIWLSPRARFAPGTPIRGGIPVCWPWFGAHPQDEKLPAHGIARLSSWRVASTRRTGDGGTEVELELSAGDQAGAPPLLSASLSISVGQTLRLALTTRNEGGEACSLSEALHSYFQIGDIAEVSVLGLEDGCYLDKVAGGAMRRQSGPVGFDGELDRVYVHSRATCLIADTRLARRIRIDKSGSETTVLWSPGADKAGRMADVGAESWRRMVCVETANALDNRLSLGAGESHTLVMSCAVERL